MVYALICMKEKCKKACLVETKIVLKFRLAHHVRNQTLDKTTGEHFSLPGQSLSDLSILSLNKAKEKNYLFRI